MNLTARQCAQPDLLSVVRGAVDRAGIDPAGAAARDHRVRGPRRLRGEPRGPRGAPRPRPVPRDRRLRRRALLARGAAAAPGRRRHGRPLAHRRPRPRRGRRRDARRHRRPRARARPGDRGGGRSRSSARSTGCARWAATPARASSSPARARPTRSSGLLGAACQLAIAARHRRSRPRPQRPDPAPAASRDADDAPRLFELASDPDVTRWFSWGPYSVQAEAEAYLDRLPGQRAKGEQLDLVAEHHEDGVIGITGPVGVLAARPPRDRRHVVRPAVVGDGRQPRVQGAPLPPRLRAPRPGPHRLLRERRARPLAARAGGRRLPPRGRPARLAPPRRPPARRRHRRDAARGLGAGPAARRAGEGRGRAASGVRAALIALLGVLAPAPDLGPREQEGEHDRPDVLDALEDPAQPVRRVDRGDVDVRQREARQRQARQVDVRQREPRTPRAPAALRRRSARRPSPGRPIVWIAV